MSYKTIIEGLYQFSKIYQARNAKEAEDKAKRELINKSDDNLKISIMEINVEPNRSDN